MHILHVISGIEPENGGPTAALSGLARALVAEGHRVSIVATWKHRTAFAVGEELKAGGIGVQLLGPTRRPFRTHPALATTLRTLMASADVVHIHAMWEAIEHEAAVIARELGKAYVWTPHGMLDEWNMRARGWFKRACLAWRLRRDLNGAAAIHVASEFERRNVSRLRLRPRFIVEGFGLDNAVLDADPPAGAFRAKHGINAQTPLVLYLGRIQHGKGLEYLVPAMAMLKHRDAVLAVAGPDERNYQTTVEQLAKQSSVSARVRFLGMQDFAAKLSALRDADVLAAPSAHENFGIAVAEGIAVGTPVVVSDQVGLADFVRNHALGQVTRLEISAIASAIDTVLEARPRASQRTKKDSDVIRSMFDWRAIARRWIAHYQAMQEIPA